MRTKLWCYDLPKAQILCIYRSLGIRIDQCQEEKERQQNLIYDYNHQPESDDIANETMNGDIVYGGLDSLVQDTPLN
ncbi:hypothetical protein CAEBREN_15665 [Caenorhabditis brenneri]|uniref:Uncharacterized protein n=1 Tax=Caenorhabditis brenneri TaxID=135651 RepID=G0NRX5_CAEBE|nr:hypothetical protein CAEBREN_15665 [Caenorhabditis brenneri]